MGYKSQSSFQQLGVSIIWKQIAGLLQRSPEYAKWFWALPDILSGELWVLRQTFWDFAGHGKFCKKKRNFLSPDDNLPLYPDYLPNNLHIRRVRRISRTLHHPWYSFSFTKSHVAFHIRSSKQALKILFGFFSLWSFICSAPCLQRPFLPSLQLHIHYRKRLRFNWVGGDQPLYGNCRLWPHCQVYLSSVHMRPAIIQGYTGITIYQPCLLLILCTYLKLKKNQVKADRQLCEAPDYR